MKLLREIHDFDVLGKNIEKSKGDYELRIAARAIVIDEQNNVAILSTKKSINYHHKLPGGGVEEGEYIVEALRREIIEETGCNIEIISEIGKIIEYRNKINLNQVSYCYFAKVKGEKGTPCFTKNEIDSGYELLWLPIDKIMELFNDTSPSNYYAKFIKLREYTTLIEGKKLIKI